MSNEQKGILIALDASNWKQLEREFTVTRELVNDLAVSDIEYVYLAERGNQGGYFTGYVGLVRKITIEPASTPQNRVYSFELSQFVRPSSVIGALQFKVEDKRNGDMFDWSFEQILEDAKVSDDPKAKAIENPANLDLQPLSINEAIERLAGTYGIDSEKISISITG